MYDDIPPEWRRRHRLSDDFNLPAMPDWVLRLPWWKILLGVAGVLVGDQLRARGVDITPQKELPQRVHIPVSRQAP